MGLEPLLADAATFALPGAALLISMVAVALSAFMGSRSSGSAEVTRRMNDMKDEIEDLREHVEECEKDRNRLERQNINLMKRILKLENGNGGGDAP